MKEIARDPNQGILDFQEMQSFPPVQRLDTPPRMKINQWTRIEYGRLSLAFFLVLQVGMSDASLGALLTSIQSRYQLSYSFVSFVFLVNVAGWSVSCPTVPFLLHHFGLRVTLLLASMLNITAGVIVVCNPSFGVVIFGLLLFGIGAGINDASLSTYTARLAHGSLMSALYAFVSIGALVSPLIIAGMLGRSLSWNKYYYVPIGTGAFSLFPLWYLFGGYQPPPEEEDYSTSFKQRYWRSMITPSVLVGGILASLSLASGEILSGWVVSFMVTIRRGEEVDMRYVLSGFWAGQTVGRLALIYPTTKLRGGPKISVPTYLIVCIGLLAVLQFVPSIPGDAVAVALFGMFLGPVTPSVVTIVSKQVSPALLSPTVSIITTVGLVGSALGPLVIGFINSAGGLRYLGAILMGMVGVLLLLWGWAATRQWKNKEE